MSRGSFIGYSPWARQAAKKLLASFQQVEVTYGDMSLDQPHRSRLSSGSGVVAAASTDAGTWSQPGPGEVEGRAADGSDHPAGRGYPFCDTSE